MVQSPSIGKRPTAADCGVFLLYRRWPGAVVNPGGTGKLSSVVTLKRGDRPKPHPCWPVVHKIKERFVRVIWSCQRFNRGASRSPVRSYIPRNLNLNFAEHWGESCLEGIDTADKTSSLLFDIIWIPKLLWSWAVSFSSYMMYCTPPAQSLYIFF